MLGSTIVNPVLVFFLMGLSLAICHVYFQPLIKIMLAELSLAPLIWMLFLHLLTHLKHHKSLKAR